MKPATIAQAERRRLGAALIRTAEAKRYTAEEFLALAEQSVPPRPLVVPPTKQEGGR